MYSRNRVNNEQTSENTVPLSHHYMEQSAGRRCGDVSRVSLTSTACTVLSNLITVGPSPLHLMDRPRQYSGYGGLYGGYGGYVECCEGVVDPILLLGVIVGESTHFQSLSHLSARPGSSHLVAEAPSGHLHLRQESPVRLSGGDHQPPPGTRHSGSC